MKTVPLLAAMVAAANDSVEDLRGRISDVKLGPIVDNRQTILFNLDGSPYQGVLRGRNVNLCMGFGEEQDRAIAVRVFVDDDAQPV